MVFVVLTSHLAQCLQGPSVLSQNGRIYFFLKAKWHSYISHLFYPFIHRQTLKLFTYLSWLLWLILQWTCVSIYAFEIMISILSDIWPEVELLDHMIVQFLILQESHTPFHNGCHNSLLSFASYFINGCF